MGLGIIFSVILLIPTLLVLFFVFLTVVAFMSNMSLAALVMGVVFLGSVILVVYFFAFVRIGFTQTGLSTDWRRLNERVVIPWELARIRHVVGPLFVIGNAKRVSLLSWILVKRPREFCRQLSRWGARSRLEGVR